uniref:SDG905 n=1 Tax=Arundo donax TaxID=35708 RepID=A0A0A9CTD0_ARUDO
MVESILKSSLTYGRGSRQKTSSMLFVRSAFSFCRSQSEGCLQQIALP